MLWRLSTFHSYQTTSPDFPIPMVWWPACWLIKSNSTLDPHGLVQPVTIISPSFTYRKLDGDLLICFLILYQFQMDMTRMDMTRMDVTRMDVTRMDRIIVHKSKTFSRSCEAMKEEKDPYFLWEAESLESIKSSMHWLAQQEVASRTARIASSKTTPLE